MSKLEYNNGFINYEAKLNNDECKTTIVVFHGLWSSLNSKKAQFIKQLCEQNNINYVIFDYFAHGSSSGHFEEFTYNKALESCLAIVDKLVKNKCLIFGSSLGGWLAFTTALARREKVQSIITVAPAVDFITYMSANKHLFNYDNDGNILISSEIGILKISNSFIKSVEDYKLLDNNSTIKLNIPIRLLQGCEDKSVPYKETIKLMEKIESDDAKLILVKKANHSFSDDFCLRIIEEEVKKLAF